MRRQGKSYSVLLYETDGQLETTIAFVWWMWSFKASRNSPISASSSDGSEAAIASATRARIVSSEVCETIEDPGENVEGKTELKSYSL